MIERILFTATAVSAGGRHGKVRSSDGIVDVGLTLPVGVGGPGTAGRTTPEDLFACGYSACFGSAVEFAAEQRKVAIGEVTITAEVGIGPLDTGGFGLTVALTAAIPGPDRDGARALLAAAHAICPYSNAIKGNVPVSIALAE